MSAHRALPLAVVEARARANRKPWPMTCPTCNTGTPGECDCPTEAGSACSEFLRDGEPLTTRELARFWATTAAPAVITGLAYVFLVWGFKP